MKRIMVALGGNALGNTISEISTATLQAADVLTDIIAQGHEVIITHGNGPQVGMLTESFAYATKHGGYPDIPLAACTAMTQGYIGYYLQQAMEEQLATKGIAKQMLTTVSEIIVDANDPAYHNPTKPIGPFYTADEVEQLQADGKNVMEDAGRGYRVVVPSPKPIGIKNKQQMLKMLDVGLVPIVAGGGGIPVIATDTGYTLTDVVVDKDFTAATIAEALEADILLILTAVEHAATDFNQPTQQAITKTTVAEMEKYCANGEFAVGSMLPKVEAAMKFANSASGRVAIITSLAEGYNGLVGKTGTHIQ